MKNIIQPKYIKQDEEAGWMKKIRTASRFLSLLLASCLLSLTVLSVSVLFATSSVDAIPFIHSVGRD